MNQRSVTVLLNLWTALGAAALTAATCLNLKRPVNYLWLLLTIALTFIVYSSLSGAKRGSAWEALLTPIGEVYGRLRKIPFLKLFVIAISWTLLTAAIPMWVSHTLSPLLLLSRFMLVAAISILFDVVDMEHDKGVITTLATSAGALVAALIALGLIAASSITEYIALASTTRSMTSGFIFIGLFYLTPGRTWWKSLMLDGVMILYFIGVLLSQ